MLYEQLRREFRPIVRKLALHKESEVDRRKAVSGSCPRVAFDSAEVLGIAKWFGIWKARVRLFDLHNGADSQPSTTTNGLQTPPTPTPPHLMDQRHHPYSPRGSDRMPESNA